ncbi:MAG: hypothetical protein HYT43_02125 [Candidatus Taylorbacteria bacterium]|nr:hypothetical protein [Candidatus Taylorbacteria bacterium]
MEIIPAIIPENFDDLRRKVSLVRGLVDVVHIDVSDGKFSPALNWPLSGDKEGDFGKFVKGDVSFPFWEELGFEVHLMLEGPEEQIDSWVSAGARRVIAHVESTSNLERLIKDFRQKSPKSSKLSSNPEFGMALLLDTPIELIYQHVEAADFVQLMSIAEIGYQGGEFRYEVLDK